MPLEKNGTLLVLSYSSIFFHMKHNRIQHKIGRFAVYREVPSKVQEGKWKGKWDI